MKELFLSNGEKVKTDCLSCSIVNGMIEPDGGVILETQLFHAHQDVAYPIRGLVILASKRHVKALDELTEEERKEYMEVLYQIRKAQRDVLGIQEIYYFYNEDTTHHFHTWMVPRYEWMYEFGRSVESVRPVLLHARNNRNKEPNLSEVRNAIDDLKGHFKRI
ncbi:diadenosine tetraphosphate hydrolase [Bacillaceae bacterium S4-13-58]